MERLVPNAVVAVDAVILTVADGAVHAALAPGAAGAPAGAIALPGVLLLEGEGDAEGLARLVRTKLSGQFAGAFRRLGFSAEPRRDPRGRVVSLTHVGLLRVSDREAFQDASGHRLCAVARGEGRTAEVRQDGRPARVAYDHAGILQDALAWLRSELPRGGLTRDLLGDLFTLSDLRGVYEAVFGVAVSQTSFDYHVRTKGLAERTALVAEPAQGRPANLFRPPSAPPQHWEPTR